MKVRKFKNLAEGAHFILKSDLKNNKPETLIKMRGEGFFGFSKKRFYGRNINYNGWKSIKGDEKVFEID